MSTYLILSIVVGLVALGVAVMLSNAISAANAGTARMKEIAGYIHEGAMAFLYREYKYLAIFIVVVAAIIIRKHCALLYRRCCILHLRRLSGHERGY